MRLIQIEEVSKLSSPILKSVFLSLKLSVSSNLCNRFNSFIAE